MVACACVAKQKLKAVVIGINMKLLHTLCGLAIGPHIEHSDYDVCVCVGLSSGGRRLP